MPITGPAAPPPGRSSPRSSAPSVKGPPASSAASSFPPDKPDNFRVREVRSRLDDLWVALPWNA